VVVELLIVVVLILINGMLAMSEMALVSSRPARLKARMEKGDRGAAAALTLSENPGRFLSTVQIGITLVGVLSGAFSGATLGARLGAALPAWGVPERFALELGVALVVVAITYLSLIAGELVPKQVALANPEAVASRVAPPMRLLSRVALPLVWLLEISGKAVLALLGQRGERAPAVSDEEIRLLIAEAEGAGVMDKRETEMISGVMRFADRSARGLMTPRHEVEIALASDSRERVLERFRTSGHSRLPLRDGGPDDMIGVISSRSLLNAPPGAIDLRALAEPVSVIHESLASFQVVERLKAEPGHMLLVYDEYGHFQGIITAMDILGAVAGGFDETEDDEDKIVEREDGSLLVSGWMPVDEFAERTGIPLARDRVYETVAGLVLDAAQDLPRVGQSVTIGNWVIEVVDLDGRRIDKVLATRRAL